MKKRKTLLALSLAAFAVGAGLSGGIVAAVGKKKKGTITA